MEAFTGRDCVLSLVNLLTQFCFWPSTSKDMITDETSYQSPIHILETYSIICFYFNDNSKTIYNRFTLQCKLKGRGHISHLNKKYEILFFHFYNASFGLLYGNENASVNHKVRREIKKSKLLYYEIKDNATILLTYITYWVLLRKLTRKLKMTNLFAKSARNNLVHS